ncbi:MAG: fructose-1,6-bisphosphatase, partial [Alphaproteobacteria bacterium]|nr:fructose-1,6-bisphosphatase [Alphaproteobacteria bacterium]
MTLSQFLINTRRQHPEAGGSFNELIHQIALACKAISRQIAKGALTGMHGEAGGDTNVQGEVVKKLDVVSNDIMLACTGSCEGLAGLVSEEMDNFASVHKKGKYLILFDPLDGSSNIDINGTVGTIFSVLRKPNSTTKLKIEDFLQPGNKQLAAGYALYGPSTMLVLTLGDGVHGFTLDAELGEFILTHPDMKLPHRASVFAINASNRRFWEAPVKRYVEECLAGKSGPRGRDFNMS